MISSHLSSPRSISRQSSRSSFSGGHTISPQLVSDDPVVLRQQMSNLRHSIRQQTAQLNNLETIVLRGPRPLPPGIMGSPPASPTEPDIPVPPRISKRSSREILHGLAGPESSLPLPRESISRTVSQEGMDGIKEGIPSSFASGSSSTVKRQSSPTRSLSRIPVASVGNARMLTEEGPPPSVYLNDTPSNFGVTFPTIPGSVSPNRRASFTPSGTTKVLADLQAGILSTRTKLDDTKHQLRQSQRQVSQLTRQAEDLKEVRERFRLENEGLNNVVARKERLLQELLERARKAESEVVTLRAQSKNESTVSKKTIRDMETTVAVTTALSQKSEREYITLRDSLEGMKNTWKADADNLRAELIARDEKALADGLEAAKKYRSMADELRASQTDEKSIKAMRAEDERIRSELQAGFREQINQLRTEMERQAKDSNEAVDTARRLEMELNRLRRMMRDAGAAVKDATESQTPSS